MANIDQLLKSAEKQIEVLANNTFKNASQQAINSGKTFLQGSKDELQQWTVLLETKQITPDNFKSLIAGKAALLQMDALVEAGLAQAEVDAFVNGAINIVFQTALAAIP